MTARSTLALAPIALIAACGEVEPSAPPIVPTEPTAAAVFDVLTYNVFLRGPAWAFRDNQRERMRHLPSVLNGYDAVVLQEAFSDHHRQQLLDALSPAYPYSTRVLGLSRPLREDGGVLILSRWPILAERHHPFGDLCAGVDCLADKGALYARIGKSGTIYNLFAVHAQDGATHRRVREAQFRALRAFIDAQPIDRAEPVVIAGDLNVDARGPSDEYATMLRLLDAEHVEALPRHTPTWDGRRNPLVDANVRQHLDYVLWAKSYAAPSIAFSRVLPLRAGRIDLSDHYAVHGHLELAGG